VGRLDGRVALITGGASGIGAAAVRLFAAEGAAVAILDRDGDAAARLVETLCALPFEGPPGGGPAGAVASGGNPQAAAGAAVVGGHTGGFALALTADVTDRGAVEAAMTQAVATFGRLDVLYNNAGVPAGYGPVADLSLADWNLSLAVNVTGTLVCTQAALPHLRAAGGGSVVNQSSVAALVGIPGLAAYSAAKGAVVALTRALAAELAPERIRVNAICAGTVDTPMIRPLLAARGEGDPELGAKLTAERYPIGRIGTADEIARAALFLASDESSFITGTVITADGGMTVV
jgi:NAD(P)-dependent dehydrogenase (short-subunit alcohol dehydrogenase family)